MRPIDSAPVKEPLGAAIRLQHADDAAAELGRAPAGLRTVTVPTVRPQPVWVLTTERTFASRSPVRRGSLLVWLPWNLTRNSEWLESQSAPSA